MNTRAINMRIEKLENGMKEMKKEIADLQEKLEKKAAGKKKGDKAAGNERTTGGQTNPPPRTTND